MFRQLTELPTIFNDLERVSREWNRWFEPWGRPGSIRAAMRGTFPLVNVGADADAVHIYALVPGVEPARIEVSLQDNIVTLSGDREAAPSGKPGYLRERFHGPFKRTITLPEDIDADKIEASCSDGILHVRIGRREASKPRRIAVH